MVKDVRSEHGCGSEQALLMMSPLTQAEMQNQIFVERPTAHDLNQHNRCLHELFETQVRYTPDSVALVFEDQHLTYGELDARSNRLANYLQKSGVDAETQVGLYLERSLEMVIGLLGVLKAGGAYVPLDPSYPEQRLTFMVSDAQASVILTLQQYEARLRHLEVSSRAIYLNTSWSVIAQESDVLISSSVQSDNLAYVIYTSGSTGVPKGVMITHRAIVNHMLWMLNAFPFMSMARVLQKTPFGFDASVWEFYAPLLSGACLVMAQSEGHADSAYLVATIITQQISIIQLVPTMLRAFIEEPDLDRCQSLTHVFCGGEELTVELQNRCFSLLPLHTRLYNLYGPTECTVDASFWGCERETQREFVPIGQPIAGTELYLLDEHFSPVADGCAGELFIGGAGVARGYFSRPDLTAERFLPDPFRNEAGARLYRTGDLVRRHPEGTLDYLGRLDQQIKLHGYRIEAGEIETALRRHPEVRDAVVLLHEDTTGNERLAAYIVPDNDERPHPAELQRFLQPYLPQYMIPSLYFFMDDLPLNAHGKVDRRALSSLASSPLSERGLFALEAPYVTPNTHIEKALVEIFAQVLDFKDVGVGIHDNFFALGGHSLLATQVISRVRDKIGVELSLREVFDKPTIARLAQRIEEVSQVAQRVQLPPLQAVPRESHTPLPLSFDQQRLWFLDQLMPGNPFYTIAEAWLLDGDLSFFALLQSFNALVQRHEALRTRFIAHDGRPSQLIEPVSRISLPVIDLSGLADNEQDLVVERLRSEQACISFDLTIGPLLHLCLVRRNEHTHLLFLTLHHIIADDWSMSVLLRELTVYYQAAVTCETANLPILPIQYSDYALWQQHLLSGEALTSQLAYWKHQLEGVPTVLTLPIDHPRPSVQTFRGTSHTLVLSPNFIQATEDLSRQEGVTLFMTLLAAFAVLLARFSNQNDLIIGVPIANRTRKEIEGVVGFFVNTLPLRLDLSNKLSFRSFLAQVREVALEAYAHQDVPFERLVEEIAPKRSLSHSPLCQVLFALQNLPSTPPNSPALRMQPLPETSSVAKFDLALELSRSTSNGTNNEDGIRGRFTYSSDLFDPATIERLASHYQTVLSAAVKSPDEDIAFLPLLSPAERHALLSVWNATEMAYPVHVSVHELVERQVERTPDAVAVADEEEGLTYEELNRRATALASALCERGIGSEHLVGVCLERSVLLVISLLAILKTGAAYLPLDPGYPAGRLRFMLSDAQVSLLLTTTTLSSLFSRLHAPMSPLLCLDSKEGQDLLARIPTMPSTASLPDALAYVIYTSGSTGQPKGVQLTHRGLSNLVNWHRQTFGLTALDRTTHLAGLSFDAAVWELWPALTVGATLSLVPEEARLSPELLRSWLLAQSITHSFVPTPLAEQLLTLGWPAETALRMLLTGGDVLHQGPAKALPFALVNNYGPTEATVVTTSGFVAPGNDSSPSIGRPIANTQTYVLDPHLQPVPIGVVGDLYIGGEGVARGYLGRPDLTAQRFIPHPFSEQPGARLYQTGDLVRYRADGSLAFVGRSDQQVKLRGYRIEPGEIETLLRQHASIREAIVIVREDIREDKRLVAYIVPEPEAPLTLHQLRQYLQNRLPHYMLPTAIVTLEEIPLSRSGKPDRQALPPPEADNSQMAEQYVPPHTPTEKTLTSVWAELLGVERIGIYDNFFELGGHSLLATQVISRIKGIFQVDLPVRTIFEQPCVAELAQIVMQMQESEADATVMPTIMESNKQAVNINEEDAKRLLERLDTLSAEEVDALLSSMFSQEKGES